MKNEQISLAANLFEVLLNQREVESRPIGNRLPIDGNNDEKIQRPSKMHS
jgi:hypothetical protein